MKIFISGASRGLGLYLAKEFLTRGHLVWGIGRSALETGKLDLALRDHFFYSQCDTTVGEEVKKTFAAMLKADFIPEITLFCAGGAKEDTLAKPFEIDRFKDNFNLNLFGVLFWIELMLPYFLQRKAGTFAAISSMSVHRENHRNRIGYSAAKLALNKSFENLRMQHLNSGVRFVIFNIGRIRERQGLVGTSYPACAALIERIFSSARAPDVVAIPRLQSLLTRMSILFPKTIYHKYFFK